MVRLLPSATSIPPLIVSEHPSVRIKCTFPLTEIRILLDNEPMVIVPFTTYHVSEALVPHAVSAFVTSAASVQVAVVQFVPFSSQER